MQQDIGRLVAGRLSHVDPTHLGKHKISLRNILQVTLSNKAILLAKELSPPKSGGLWGKESRCTHGCRGKEFGLLERAVCVESER